MNKILSLMSKISGAGNAFITAKLKKYNYANLAPSHGDILVVLYQHKKVTMQDLAEKIGKTKATVTVLIDKLENIGFVKREKSTADSRVTYVSLAKKGIKFKPVFESISKELNQMLYKHFTKNELTHLECLLEKILKNV